MIWNYLNHATLDSFRQMHKFNYRKRDRNTSSSLSTTRNWKLVIDITTNWVKNSTDSKVNAFSGRFLIRWTGFSEKYICYFINIGSVGSITKQNTGVRGYSIRHTSLVEQEMLLFTCQRVVFLIE